jgi:hypothetical protein
MALKIELTTYWEPERMLEVWPSLLTCIRRFVNEFPEETSEQHIIDQVLAGRRQLWVVYDEEDAKTALLAVLTESKTFDATGRTFVEIVGIGGERIREALPLIADIEQWAVEHGIESSMVIGRFGWIPMLKEHGYEKKAVILRKRLGDSDGQRDTREQAGE